MSAIGYAAPELGPPGREEQQDFDDRLRSRLAYVEGTVVQVLADLPTDVRPVAADLADAAAATDHRAASQQDRGRALRRYRALADEAVAACDPSSSGR